MPQSHLIRAVLFLLGLFVFSSIASASEVAGSNTCSECHRQEASSWEKSHHGWALRKPSPENVLGDFGDASFEYKGVLSRFSRSGEDFVVETDGPDGKITTYTVRYVVGVAPLQQYLVETEGGRLQALDIAWDTEQKKWFHLYPEQDVSAGNGLHWTGSYKNWQSRCAECHQTGFDKGYDVKSRTYQTKWAELTVGCESCHGPSAAHVQSMRSGNQSSAPVGLKMGPGQQHNELAVCGPCHARREAFSQQSAPVGARLSDHYNLSLLTPDLYFADGQQREEVFILGSFLQSKMKAKGVTCSNCHEPHSGKLVAEGDAVCTQCHSESGNTAFPTLARKNFDLPSHHHHTPGTEAAACVSCHMPDRAYMMIDKRRDHFFRRPDPRQSAAAGAPDACTQCHQDKTQAWAAEQIDAWFPDADKSWQDRSPLVAFMSGDRSESVVEALTRYAADISRPAIVRATAADVLGESGIAGSGALAEKLLGDDDDLVRSAAAKLLRSSPDEQKVSLLTPLLTDPASAVRQAVARELAGTDLGKIPEADRPAFSKALNEYMASRGANADMPESHMALGGLALSMRSWGNAEAAFKLATDLDPQLADGWLILARLREALGDQAGAEKYLSAGLERSPTDMALMFERAALEGRKGSFENAVDWYRRIVGLYPKQTEGWLGLANAALEVRNPSLALDASAKALELSPTDTDALLIRAAAYFRLGDQTKAKETAQMAKKLSPDLQLPAELEKLIQQE